jgi:acyl-CoA synthetase (NDP forming)
MFMRKTLEIAGRDPNSDGLLVILTPQAMTDCTGTAEKLKAFGHIEGKPVLASWMGGQDIAQGEAILNAPASRPFRIPTPRRACSRRCIVMPKTSARFTKRRCRLRPMTTWKSGRAKAKALIEAVKRPGA